MRELLLEDKMHSSETSKPKEIQDKTEVIMEMERCLFCLSESASFPIMLQEGSKVICDSCVKLIPTHAFIRCDNCGNSITIEVDEYYKEDTIMDMCFKRGMDKVEVAEELITSKWTPLIMTVDICKICEEVD